MVCRAAPAQVSQRPRDYAQVAIRVRPLRTVACVTVRGTEAVHRVQGEIEEVRQVMVENIERVLERGEKIELLVDKTENLNHQAFRFKKQSRALRNMMWRKNVKIVLFALSLVEAFNLQPPSEEDLLGVATAGSEAARPLALDGLLGELERVSLLLCARLVLVVVGDVRGGAGGVLRSHAA